MNTYISPNGKPIKATEKAYNVIYKHQGYVLAIPEGEDHNNTADVDKYHKGSGYYEFPNGETIRGKEKAQKYLLALKDEKGGQQ
ncbi:hypothetical protein ABFV99_00495 [Cytobacillus horneckiae]|uniref:hypothetical protein n=1 Tax=Cytobacillus horneckiae TaxID=549687 RepID=UPI0034CD1812